MFKNLKTFKSFSSHSYDTSGKHLLRPDFQRISLTQHNIAYRGAKMSISVLQPNRNARGFQIFKSKMRNYLISKCQ